MESPRVLCRYLGPVSYEPALHLQENLRELLKQESLRPAPLTHHLLGLEHPQVITLGRRAEESREVLIKDGTPIVKVDRGGLATLHGPGQLVIYPIFQLPRLGLGVRDWVQVLLEVTQEMLSSYGVDSTLSAHPAGLYTSHGKIGFIGVQIRGGISTHGISINVKNDLTEFQKIHGCGVAGLSLDSMAAHISSEKLILKEVFEKWSVILLKNLGAVEAAFDAGLVSQSQWSVDTGGRAAGPNH